MGQDVTFDIIARDRASSAFSKVGKSANSSESALSKFGASAKKVFAAAAVYEGAKLAAKGLVGMAKAAAEDQTSVALLVKQYRNSAHATDQQIKSTEAYVDALGRTKGITDDVARGSLGTLIVATHNVTKAQKLNNLALDVATARNKPLAAVSLALAKAYSGNVSGLGRLGIATKNAAGKTKSFGEIQRDLNKQFGGAAAAKANTFTGVLDKFHVAVNEAGEAVGYKLLPQLTRIVPKISTFITQMQNGTGAGGDFADTVREEIIPVAKNLASQGKLIFGALKPVLELLSKLPPQVLATGGAVGFLAPKLGGLRTPLDENAKATEKFGRGLSSLAGAGGLLAVADTANRSSKELGALEGALGGAAAGFAATGNPIGALVGAAGGGLLGIFSSGHKAADGISAADQSARDAIAGLDGLSESVDNVLKGYDKLARQEIGAALRKSLGGSSAALDTVGKLGLSIKTLTQAALGNPKALNAVSAAVDKASSAYNNAATVTDQYGNTYKNVSAQQLAAAGAAGDIARALGLTTDKLKSERKEALIAALATGKFGQVLKGIPDAKVLRIATEGAPKARADIIDLASRGKRLSDNQIRILLKSAGLPNTLADIEKVKAAAERAAKPRTIKFNVKVSGSTSAAVAEYVNGGGGGSNERSAGASYMSNLAAGIAKGTPKVKVAITRAKNLLDSLTSTISNLQSARDGFTSTFSADSIFGADISTTGSLNGLLKFQSNQAKTAAQLVTDIQSVTSKGLSKGLVAQLQSAGSAGAAQLHLLAGASAEQIGQFNALDASTAASNQAGGLLLGNYGRGGNIDTEIAAAKRDAAVVAAFERALSHMKLTTKISGGDLIIAIRSTNHSRGRSPGDFSR